MTQLDFLKSKTIDTAAGSMISKTDLAQVRGLVDAENFTIKGVSVLSVGEALGHDMQIDVTTLEQVKEAAEGYGAGLKVKTDHFSGFNQIVGTLRNFQIDGDQLRADMHLLATHEATLRILEMSESMPESFGLSIAFSGEHLDSGEVTFARCSEIYSADLVDAPAANPTGLFSEKVDSAEINMDENQIAALIADALAPLQEKLSELESRLAVDDEATEDATEDATEEAVEEVEAEEKPRQADKAMSDLAAEVARLSDLVKNFGATPAPNAVLSDKEDGTPDPTTFSEAIAAVKKTGLDGSAATRQTIKQYPDLFLAAREQGIRNL